MVFVINADIFSILLKMFCGRGGIGRRTRLRIWRLSMQVQVLSPAPNYENYIAGTARNRLFYKMVLLFFIASRFNRKGGPCRFTEYRSI